MAGLAMKSILNNVSCGDHGLIGQCHRRHFAIRAYRRDYNWQVLKINWSGMSIGVLVGGLTAHMVLEYDDYDRPYGFNHH